MNKLTESKKRQYIAEGNKSKWFRNLSEERKSEIVEKYMSSEFLDLKCDWAFKFVMSSPEILIILLNDFLPETVTEVVSVSTEPKRLGGSEKNVLMDVAARLQTVPEDEMMNYFKSVILDNERLEYGEDRFAEGLAEGLAKGKTEVANNLLAMGISSETVSKATGLSAEGIAAL